MGDGKNSGNNYDMIDVLTAGGSMKNSRSGGVSG